MTAVVTTLIKHESTFLHKEKVKALQIPSAHRIDSMVRVQQMGSNLTNETELRLAAFIAEHSLSFHIMYHFSDLPKLCHDFKIASEVRCKRTKTKSVVTNVMAPHFHSNFVHSLKKAPFSLIFDETTDIFTKKELALVTCQYNKERWSVSCLLYELIEQTAEGAEAIFQSICSVLANDGIPLSNVVGFAADTTNAVWSAQQSYLVLNRKFQNSLPCVVFATVHIYVHLTHVRSYLVLQKFSFMMFTTTSAKRQGEFQKFQVFANVEPHKILKRCETRWLSLHSCVQRLIEKWDALVLYFQSVAVNDNLLASQKIISQLQNPIWKLTFIF